MKTQAVLFYLVFTLTHVLFNGYIYLRGREALAGRRGLRALYTGLFIFFFLSSTLDMFLYRMPASPLFVPLHWAGSFWYGAMFYFFVAALLVDAGRLGLYIAGAEPRAIYADYARTKALILLAVVSLVTGTLAWGHRHALDVKVTTVRLAVHKSAGPLKRLSIAMISDIHVSRIIGAERLAPVVERINGLAPDLVLMPGDIVDSVVEPFLEDRVDAVFARLRPRLGVYACTGNHEYYGDIDRTIPAIERSGVRFLRDRVTLVDNAFYLAGREDRTARQYIGPAARRPLPTVLAGIDPRRPVIVMDHNPASLREAVEYGVDLQVSGHTHHGQMFPFMYITDLIYECSYGLLRRGASHVFVSSGLGSWGPPVRIGTDAEIVHLIIDFD